MEKISRVERNGNRYYRVEVNGELVGEFPSVTTILGETSDKSGLVKWRERVGEEEANRISKLSTSRGTVMHRLIELYKSIEGDKNYKLERLNEMMQTDEEITQFDAYYIEQGYEFFMKFYNNSSKYFDRVKKVLAAEKFLWCVKGGGYAGTVDNVSELHDGRIVVIDYKNANKPKEEKWIQDYYFQAAAYTIAYWERTGIRPIGAEIWIANELEGCPQTFSLNENDIKIYFKLFRERLDKFKNI